MRCSMCQAPDGRPVFRTQPPGQRPAGWQCRPCIEAHHDVSLIDPATQELVEMLTQPAPRGLSPSSPESVVTCTDSHPRPNLDV